MFKPDPRYDCLAKRRPDEPYFVILGRDPAAGAVIRDWCEHRLAAIEGGERPQSEREQIKEALAVAQACDLYFVQNNKTADVKTDKLISSSERWYGKSTIFGRDGEHKTPYMTRYWIGHLRFHVFHRGDQDPDHHDHPWGFWTFPFTSYVEEFVAPSLHKRVMDKGIISDMEPSIQLRSRVVRRFLPHWRPATHCHRVLGAWDGTYDANGTPGWKHGNIYTLVLRTGSSRKWGFLKNREGQWCWTPWRDYIFGGGKDAACSPPR